MDLYNLCGSFRMVGGFYHYCCSAKAKTCLCIPPCAIPGMGNPRDRIDDNFSSGSYYSVYRTFHNSIQMMRVVQEYQRGVLFRFGRLQKVIEPGFNLILPFGIDSLRKVDMRTFTIDVPKQEVITRDNVPVIVDAVVYFNVFDPMLAVVKIADYTKSTSLLAQTILRSVLGQHELDEMLSQRAQLGQILQRLLDEATDPWGIKVSAVEIKAVELAETMKRAMARQAEAERERRAKIIAAEGELQASEKLAQAADVLAQSPASLQLRYLQTLTEIAVEKNSTIVFPLPMDLLKVISKAAEKSSE